MMTAFDQKRKGNKDVESFDFTDESGQKWTAHRVSPSKYAVQAKKDGNQKTTFEIEVSPEGGYDVTTKIAYFR